MFEQVLNEVSPDYRDKIQMYKVDIEDQIDLAIQFGARGVPYMVFISKDGGVNSNVGAMDENTLKYYFEGLLSK
jgi:thioredoxin-like negative regulator of GroEL